MVNSVSSGFQSYQTVQPSFTSGAETRAVTDQVQPRQAPAANAQRSDQKLSRDEDNTQVEFRSRAAEQSNARPTAEASDGPRGSNLDISV